ncbi:hypothetical protein KXW38_001462, partial [Aspergillus fumigatus]
LCGDVAFLGKLGIVQRHARCLEIGAAILPVGIEEQRIKPPVEIVVMGDILLGAAARIELLQVADDVAQPPPRLGQTGHHFRLVHDDGQQVCDRAVLDHESAVHPGFAERQLRVEQDAPCGSRGCEARRHRLAGAVSAGECGAERRGKGQTTAADEMLQNVTQQTVHRSTNGTVG